MSEKTPKKQSDDLKSKFTRPLANRIGVVFDFDDTLAPDSIEAFRTSIGLDNDTFWSERVQPRINDGWDPIPAAFYCLIQESRDRDSDDKVTQQRLAKYGRDLEFFDGVPQMFDRLRWSVHEIDPETEVEFYLISCGVGEIIRNTPIAENFKAIWASEFAYDENGEIEFIKRFISHTEKTRFLFHLAEGIDKDREEGESFVLARDVPEDELHVPLHQIVYVGDGLTDSPAFSIISRESGVALGVYKPESQQKWGKNMSKVTQHQRVENLAPVDYSEDSELLQSLLAAVKSIAFRIQLRKMSQGE